MRTTFIIGAGASCELGLPSGDKLMHQIVELLTPELGNAYGFKDDRMIGAIQQQLGVNGWQQGDAVEQLKAAAAKICRGLPLSRSVDNFLHSHQDDLSVVALGKLAIAMLILEAEKGSALFVLPSAFAQERGLYNQPRMSATSNKVAETWYKPLAQLLMSGVPANDAASTFDNVSFVIFNYDRCVEQFLFLAVQDYFDLTEYEAAAVLGRAEFIHPYGSLGPLPWQIKNDEPSVSLGGTEGINYQTLAANIRTFTESVESLVGARVKEAVASAFTLVILGFGYLEQNVELLRPPANRAAGKVMSTAYGVSPLDQQIIFKLLGLLSREGAPEVFVDTATCRQMFDHFGITLGFS